MRYLGSISGNGIMKCNGFAGAPVSYNFEGYTQKGGAVTGAGEIELAPAALKAMFGRSGIQLETEDGHMFDLRFSEQTIQEPDFAHVEITGGLPDEWTADQ